MISWCTECGVVVDGKHSPDCYFNRKRYFEKRKRISEYSSSHIAIVEDGKIVIKPKSSVADGIQEEKGAQK